MTLRTSRTSVSQRLSRRMMVSGAFVVAAAALFCAVPVAHADTAPKGVNAEFIVILASQADDAGPDDPEVKKWNPAGPLSLFKTRKVLSIVAKTRLVQGAPPVMLRVPDGPTLGVTFKDTTRDEKKGIRHSLSAELKSGTGATTVGITAGPDDRLFIAGPTYKSGTLFFGIHVFRD